jgi:hypothetical protein
MQNPHSYNVGSNFVYLDYDLMIVLVRQGQALQRLLQSWQAKGVHFSKRCK